MAKLKTKRQMYFQIFKKAIGDFMLTSIFMMHPDQAQGPNSGKRKK